MTRYSSRRDARSAMRRTAVRASVGGGRHHEAPGCLVVGWEVVHILRHGWARVLYPRGTHEAEATSEVDWWDRSRADVFQPYHNRGV